MQILFPSKELAYVIAQLYKQALENTFMCKCICTEGLTFTDKFVLNYMHSGRSKTAFIS